jgi:hypothetical protein
MYGMWVPTSASGLSVLKIILPNPLNAKSAINARNAKSAIAAQLKRKPYTSMAF